MAPTNGKKTGNTFTFGSTVTLTCLTGYYITGKQATDKTLALVCQADRTWNGTEPTCSRKATVIIFFVSRHIKTPKATLLGEKKIIWAKKKKVLRLPTSSSSSGDSVFQALNGCFSLQHCGIMLHFCSKYIKKKKKKKEGKRSEMPDRLGWRRQPCLCLDGSIVVLLMSERCKTLEYEFLDPPNASVVQQAQCCTGLPLSSI